MPNQSMPAIQIDEQTLITRNNSLLSASVHDEMVFMDIASGVYYGLDDIGSEIWNRLESPCRFGELVEGLVTEYDEARSVIADDVRILLSQMAAHNFIKLA